MTEKVTVRIGLHVKLQADELHYMESAARIRKMQPARLLNLILRTVMRDQLIGAVLDDLPCEENSHVKRRIGGDRTSDD